MRVYISGKITGDEHYLKKFLDAEIALRAKGCEVLNPCDVSQCFPFLSYDEFMRLDLALVDMADALYMLRDWKDSRGAKAEHERAVKAGKKIIFEVAGTDGDKGAQCQGT
jgi:hypothetical protein